MKKKFDVMDSGCMVIVFAAIGYLFSCLMSIFGIRKKSNTDEAEAVPVEPEETENGTETENSTEE